MFVKVIRQETKTMSRRSGQLSRAGRVEDRGRWRMKDRAMEINKSGR